MKYALVLTYLLFVGCGFADQHIPAGVYVHPTNYGSQHRGGLNINPHPLKIDFHLYRTTIIQRETNYRLVVDTDFHITDVEAMFKKLPDDYQQHTLQEREYVNQTYKLVTKQALPETEPGYHVYEGLIDVLEYAGRSRDGITLGRIQSIVLGTIRQSVIKYIEDHPATDVDDEFAAYIKQKVDEKLAPYHVTITVNDLYVRENK